MRDTTECEQHRAELEVQRPLGCTQSITTNSEEEQRRAEVAFSDHDLKGSPHPTGRVSGSKMEWPTLHVVIMSSSRRSTRYAAKNSASASRELAGLEVERTEAHPDLGAVDVAPDPRKERHEEQQQTDQPERPLEALQVAHAAHDDEREHVRADAHRGPVRLQRGEVLVEARDEHVADAVEEHGERQQRAVGTRRKTSRRDMRDEEQHEPRQQQ
jgi:hypothetical protein